MYRGSNPLIEQLYDIFVDKAHDHYDNLAVTEIALAINERIETQKRGTASMDYDETMARLNRPGKF